MKNWIKNGLVVVLAMAGVAYVMKGGVEQELKERELLDKWPKSVEASGFQYCTLATYRTCKKNDWFGVSRSQEVDKLRPNHPNATDRLLDTVCAELQDPPTSRTVRFIEQSPGVTLVLCRMKAHGDIDRGKFLEAVEQRGLRERV